MVAAASAPLMLADLVQRAEKAGASDIHVQMVGKEASVSFRLDGMMAEAGHLPESIAERVVGRIKYLARMKTYQESLPQDGRIDKADVGVAHDIRVSTYPTVTGEKVVLRLFGSGPTPCLDELGFPGLVREELERFLKRSSGLLLLTGPAGSGKTTTIQACLRALAAEAVRHVITVEDPVEQIIPGVMQTEVNEALGLTFAEAARRLLRQDPQVLVIGEIRDEQTAQLVLRAALSGHLVISTLHAGSCRGVWERLALLSPDRFAVVAALELVLNQRLIRRLCPACRGNGCAECWQTGYRGRVPVVERVAVNPELREAIQSRGFSVIRPEGELKEAARMLVQDGVTDEAEWKRVFSS